MTMPTREDVRRRPRHGRAIIGAAIVVGSITSTSAAQSTNMYFGSVLASGDFDCDGINDIAAGVPEAPDGGKARAGGVELHYGSGLVDYISQTLLSQGAGANDLFGFALASGDFDLNGCADLAIGAPGKTVNGATGAGTVYVVRGYDDEGLRFTSVQQVTQTPTGHETSEANDSFGAALAAGNFAFDGADDLAVGVPYETVGSVLSAGAVHVFFGVVGSGIQYTNNQYYNQNSYAVADSAQPNDYFGMALVAGNFGYTGRMDLAIGAPGESFTGATNAGAVHVLYGYSGGLKTQTSQFFTQNSGGVETSETDDWFGLTLARGNFDGDAAGYQDLAIGAPFESIGTASEAGIVHVLYGGAEGIVSQNHLYDDDNRATNDNFGWGLIGADLNGNGLDDLIVGVRGNTIAGQAKAGQFVFLNGHTSGNLDMFTSFWSQNTSGIESNPLPNEFFGERFCAGDFDGDGTTDLAVGVPGETVNGFANAGAINVIETRGALGLTGDQGWLITQ
jgi:hypothetical protein